MKIGTVNLMKKNFVNQNRLSCSWNLWRVLAAGIGVVSQLCAIVALSMGGESSSLEANAKPEWIHRASRLTYLASRAEERYGLLGGGLRREGFAGSTSGEHFTMDFGAQTTWLYGEAFGVVLPHISQAADWSEEIKQRVALIISRIAWWEFVMFRQVKNSPSGILQDAYSPLELLTLARQLDAANEAIAFKRVKVFLFESRNDAEALIEMENIAGSGVDIPELWLEMSMLYGKNGNLEKHSEHIKKFAQATINFIPELHHFSRIYPPKGSSIFVGDPPKSLEPIVGFSDKTDICTFGSLR